jgi:hypothetical protein
MKEKDPQMYQRLEKEYKSGNLQKMEKEYQIKTQKEIIQKNTEYGIKDDKISYEKAVEYDKKGTPYVYGSKTNVENRPVDQKTKGSDVNSNTNSNYETKNNTKTTTKTEKTTSPTHEAYYPYTNTDDRNGKDKAEDQQTGKAPTKKYETKEKNAPVKPDEKSSGYRQSTPQSNSDKNRYEEKNAEKKTYNTPANKAEGKSSSNTQDGKTNKPVSKNKR